MLSAYLFQGPFRRYVEVLKAVSDADAMANGYHTRRYKYFITFSAVMR